MSDEKAEILIVEDTYIVALHLRITLESEGYIVQGTFDSGEEALAQIEKKRPTLVLLDIMLKGHMDGIEVANVINEKYKIPVIYISALSDKDTIQRAKVTEPYGFLIKPFEDRAIFMSVEMALHKHKIEAKLRESEQLYSATVESLNDAIIVIDSQCMVTYINPRALAITKLTREDTIGISINKVMHLKNVKSGENLKTPFECSSEFDVDTLPEDLSLVLKDGSEVPIGEMNVSTLSTNDVGKHALVLVFRDITEKRHQENLLMIAEREKVAAQILGQENERSRIARDLHDGLGQMLNVIKMNTNLILGQEQRINDINILIDESIQECIRISDNLLPAKLKDFDLNTCLRSLCQQQNIYSLGLTINYNGESVDWEMNQTQKVNLYRIAQEAINNAMKHTNTENISVWLRSNLNGIEMGIQNEGAKGDNKINTKGDGHGLINMRDRAEMIGGTLEIIKDKSNGWLIIAELPKPTT